MAQKKTYCVACGTLHEYEIGKKPRFCHQCSNPFPVEAGYYQPPAQARQAPVYRPQEPEYEEPDLSLDDLEISVSATNTPVLFENVFGTGSTGLEKRKGISKKDFKEFQTRVTSTSKLDVDGGSD